MRRTIEREQQWLRESIKRSEQSRKDDAAVFWMVLIGGAVLMLAG